MPTDPRHVAFFTCTFFPDPSDPVQQVRAALATETIKSIRDQGFPLVIVDGGSDPALLQIDNAAGPVIDCSDPDLVVTRQLAAQSALENFPWVSHFVWTEPEKDVTRWVLDWVKRGIEHDASVVLPMRLHMESYPLQQQLSERKGNEDIAECFEREMGDHYFGPRVFRKDALVKHWLRDYSEYETKARQWASIMSPVFGALAAGERVIGVPVDFEYPSAQRNAETDQPLTAKRIAQRQVITQSAMDIHDYLPWSKHWDLILLDGYTLENQTMNFIDLTTPESLDILRNY